MQCLISVTMQKHEGHGTDVYHGVQGDKHVTLYVTKEDGSKRLIVRNGKGEIEVTMNVPI